MALHPRAALAPMLHQCHQQRGVPGQSQAVNKHTACQTMTLMTQRSPHFLPSEDFFQKVLPTWLWGLVSLNKQTLCLTLFPCELGERTTLPPPSEDKARLVVTLDGTGTKGPVVLLACLPLPSGGVPEI